MKKLTNKDIVSGVFLIVLSVAAWFATNQFDKSSISSYRNPATVPRAVITILFVFAIMILADGIKESRLSYQSETEVEKTFSFRSRLPEILTYILIALYVTLLKPIGFVITTSVYLFLQMFVLSCFDVKNCLKFAIIALFVAPALFYIFRVFFNVFLPTGLLNWNP